MDEVRVKSRLFLSILAASLLHVSLGQRSQLQIMFSGDSDKNEVTLECLDQFSSPQPATFTFRNSAGMEESSNVTTADKRTLKFSIRPENETIVNCTISMARYTESERVAITGEYNYPACKDYVNALI